MRMLVVIKGQLRTWDLNQKHLKTFIESFVENLTYINSDKKFLENGKVDVLLSCWDVSYQIYPYPFSISDLKKESSNLETEIQSLKTSSAIANVFVFQQKFLNAHKIFSKLNFELDDEYHHQCYLTYKTGFVKRQIEVQNNFTYDYVLEIRPDVYYEPLAASYKIKVPKFGEILSPTGNSIIDLDGMVSPSTIDLIFFMTGNTYNIFCKEIVFHYKNFSKKRFFSVSHIEKNLFYMANNFQINDLGFAFCSMFSILRPNVDPEVLRSADGGLIRFHHINQVDLEWRAHKIQKMEDLIRSGKNLHEISVFEKSTKENNLQLIKELLNS